MKINRLNIIAAVVCALTISSAATAQYNIQTVKLSDSLHVLAGAGGNILVSTGPDGTLLVDSAMAPIVNQAAELVATLSKKPVRLVINTHWHFDHTDGNKHYADNGAIVIAHQNVAKRMSIGQHLLGIERDIPASPPEALPKIQLSDSLTINWNALQWQIIHVAPAHTDGDCFVYCRKANVLHIGDIWFNGQYPFFDVIAGGSLDGMIAAADKALAIADDNTTIIPGHGPVSNKPALQEYRTMLATVAERVHKLIDQGKSREEILASKVTKDFDEKWGQTWMKPDLWMGIVYDGMTYMPITNNLAPDKAKQPTKKAPK